MDDFISDVPSTDKAGRDEKLLFWACFIALIATAFGFVVRTQIIADWGREFSLSKTEQGQIFGVGLWPFSISIVLFSLIIDKIGYGKAMVFAFVCHLLSAYLTITATGYKSLYWATFVVALGNGTVEAVINPVVATLFAREKTKWLNMLHAGWPGGLVLGGILAMAMGSTHWKYKVALLFFPVIAYGILMIGRKFPVNERVAAGVSYKPMLQQVGILGAAIVVGLIVRELGNTFELATGVQITIAAVLVAAYGAYVRTLGQPLFIFLLLIMVPLATTELGTDSWIGDLMGPEMERLGLNGGWVLIYTSAIMLILRFFAGPIVHKLSPLGLLASSALVAACGLLFLSKATGGAILAAATLYGFGKTFFWPTMLGVVAEQFPKGGALTLNTTGGVGMLAVGVIGAALLGNIQDKEAGRELKVQDPQVYAAVVDAPKTSVFGKYQPLDQKKIDNLPEAQQGLIESIQGLAKKRALATVAIFPCIMFVCYVALILYFKSQGGYKPKILISEKEEELLMMGGVSGPAEL
ncbi:MFS transporter [Singulisphaera sp. Ch08]|uniref:MFS transporter n=1 Tax=Singulisphaera sp. Ch08 TaxID=3120278 RepID=A0AAU7CEZ2_9BACT